MATEEVDFLPQWKRTRTSKYAFSFRDIHLSQLWYHIYMISLFIVCLSFQENVDFKLFWEHLHLQRYQALSSLSGRDIETITAVSLDGKLQQRNHVIIMTSHRFRKLNSVFKPFSLDVKTKIRRFQILSA